MATETNTQKVGRQTRQELYAMLGVFAAMLYVALLYELVWLRVATAAAVVLGVFAILAWGAFHLIFSD